MKGEQFLILTTSIIIGALLILPSVSAALTIDDLLNQLDARTVTFFILWLIFFSFIFYSLKNVFARNPAVPAIIALAGSFGAVYGIFISGFPLEDIWNFFSISGDAVIYIGILLIFALVIFLMIKAGFATGMFTLGAIILVASFTPIIYEKGTAVGLAIILFIIGGVAWKVMGPRRQIANHY